MGQTILEKILQAHTKDEVFPGAVIWLDIDIRTARDFGGPNVVKYLEEEYPSDPIADKSRTFFTFDTVAPANNIPYAENQQICREFARKHGIKLFDVDSGIGTHTLLENGIIRPGMTAVGTDSHYNILGAIGVFGQGMGDMDIAFAFKTGKTWFEVPESVRINLKGIPRFPVTAKDVVLELLRIFGTNGLLGYAVELYGDYIDSLSLDERITIASMATEMGLISFFFPPSKKIASELKALSGYEAEFISADTDAKYKSEYTIDISNLEPLLAAPYSPGNVHPVREYLGQRIDTVFVGSCTNGRILDIHQFADLLDGHKVKDGVTARVVPATRRIFGKILEDGTLARLFNAGVIVSHAACAGCASGQIGMTGKGERQLSTGNRNFKGKQGSGETFLVSPVVAGASAKEGKIALP